MPRDGFANFNHFVKCVSLSDICRVPACCIRSKFCLLLTSLDMCLNSSQIFLAHCLYSKESGVEKRLRSLENALFCNKRLDYLADSKKEILSVT